MILGIFLGKLREIPREPSRFGFLRQFYKNYRARQ